VVFNFKSKAISMACFAGNRHHRLKKAILLWFYATKCLYFMIFLWFLPHFLWKIYDFSDILWFFMKFENFMPFLWKIWKFLYFMFFYDFMPAVITVVNAFLTLQINGIFIQEYNIQICHWLQMMEKTKTRVKRFKWEKKTSQEYERREQFSNRF